MLHDSRGLLVENSVIELYKKTEHAERVIESGGRWWRVANIIDVHLSGGRKMVRLMVESLRDSENWRVIDLNEDKNFYFNLIGHYDRTKPSANTQSGFADSARRSE